MSIDIEEAIGIHPTADDELLARIKASVQEVSQRSTVVGIRPVKRYDDFGNWHWFGWKVIAADGETEFNFEGLAIRDSSMYQVPASWVPDPDGPS